MKKKSGKVKYVFIDLDANNGVSLENFFWSKEVRRWRILTGTLAQRSSKIVQHIQTEKWEVHDYEANPYSSFYNRG